VDNKDIVIDADNFHQSVYVFRCEKSTIRVNGKVNFIALGMVTLYMYCCCCELCVEL